MIGHIIKQRKDKIKIWRKSKNPYSLYIPSVNNAALTMAMGRLRLPVILDHRALLIYCP